MSATRPALLQRKRWRSLAEGMAEQLNLLSTRLPALAPVGAVLVQGDTASAFACAQAAWLAGVPVAHVEAGLRTYRREPWPEEGFRRQIGAIARWHFAPDGDAIRNLVREGVPSAHCFNVGNTVIDTLPAAPLRVLATLHRREIWGTQLTTLLSELYRFADTAPAGSVELCVVRHPNWASSGGVSHERWTVEPMKRERMLERLRWADLVVTDSGGLQEEAAHFGRETLVLRDATERKALEQAGAVKLISPSKPAELLRELEHRLERRRCYGAGNASELIAEEMVRQLATAEPAPLALLR
jgi:UDP-N-acetylglucosamine 2-epimerase (non-hydrolysing)